MKYGIIAGSLVAHPDNHGNHLKNYLDNSLNVARTICENLILHDKIYIPIQDYYTACGLIKILGEKNFISLLEKDRIEFLRYRKRIGLVTAIDGRGEIVMITADKSHPSVCEHDESISKGLNNLSVMMKLNSRTDLEKELLKNTTSVNINKHFDLAKKNAVDVFNQMEVSKKRFNQFLKWNSLKQRNATTLSSSPIDHENPVQVMLGLMMVSYESQLLLNYKCSSSSSTVNLNAFMGLTQSDGEKLWSITESRKIPDLGKLILSNPENCKKMISSSDTRKAMQFREWFHDNDGLNPKEIQQEFNCFTEYIPWYKTFFGSAICWGSVFMTGYTFGTLAGVSQELMLKLLGSVKSKSPRYFINDLRKKFGK